MRLFIWFCADWGVSIMFSLYVQVNLFFTSKTTSGPGTLNVLELKESASVCHT
jgi:hypothetical protein